VLSGHPWVFANEVEALLAAEHDGEVEYRDGADRFLGAGGLQYHARTDNF